MKAAVYHRYGPPEVVQIIELEQPTPRDNEILIRVHATTVTSGDWRVRSLNVPFGFRLISRLIFGVFKPKQPILGTELAGEVAAIGKDVTRFQVGDPVFAYNGSSMGCHAEFKCMPEDGAVARKPENLSFEQAAALSFGGSTALHFFRKANLARGEQVLINGASGGVGTAAIQLAVEKCTHVTAVCSDKNRELVTSLGAHHVIDYVRQDFTQLETKYDVIVDTAGTAPYSRSKRVLKPGGRLLAVLGNLPTMLQAPLVGLFSNRKVIAGPAEERPEDLQHLAELAAAGKFTPVIDRCYPFEQIVEAHRYVDAGHKRGNVIVH